MGKIRKFTALNIRKIAGGKDPVRLIEEFILRHGHDPDGCTKQKTAESARWMISLGNEEELEILAEGLRTPAETTIYMGVNVVTIPVRGTHDVLAAALQIADGLVGIKVSLVGHYLVLSSTLGVAGLTVEELEYHFKLISAQQTWFREALADELGWETLPEE